MSLKPLIFKIASEDLNDRLTVESHLPEYLFIKKQLKKGLPLGEIASVTCGSTPRDKSAFRGGTNLFLKTRHVYNGYLNLRKKYHITEESHNSTLRGSKVFPEDILLTIIGASHAVIGRAVVYPKNLGEANINQNIARIRVFDKKFINPEYVEAFLNSPLGRAQSQMMSRVVGQYNLNLQEVRSIRIPIPSLKSQKQIIDVWKKAKEKRKENIHEIKKLSKIVNGDMIFSDLNFEIPQPEDTTFFTTTREISKLTVEYNRSKLVQNALLREKDKLNLQRLGDLVRFRNETVDTKQQPDAFFQLVNVGLDGKTKLREERLGKEIRYKHMKTIRKGDVLVSRISAIYGAVSIVPKQLDRSLVSSECHVLIVDPKRLTRIYLWKILRSGWIQAILEGFTTGGSRLRINESRLKELMIPVPPLSLQKSFSFYLQQTIIKMEKLRKEANTVMRDAGLKIQKEVLDVLQDEKYDVFKSIVENLAKNAIARNKKTLMELAKY